MGRDRLSLVELQLNSTASNLARAIRLRQEKPEAPLSKREELEEVFADTQRVYDVAAEDVARRGAVIKVTKFKGKRKKYEVEETNPSYRVMKSAGAQLISLAKVLSKFGPPLRNGSTAWKRKRSFSGAIQEGAVMKLSPTGCWVRELRDLPQEQQDRIRQNFELLIAAGFDVDNLDVVPHGFAQFLPENSAPYIAWQQRQPDYWIQEARTGRQRLAAKRTR